jgi:hypothetical protein
MVRTSPETSDAPRAGSVVPSATSTCSRHLEAAVPDQPNILIIWGDDIGISNLSCYSDGLMGYRTPNIDRIAA